MALNKNKMDIYIKTTNIPNNVDFWEYDYPYYGEYYDYTYDYYLYEDDVEYDYIYDLDNVDNLLNSTSILWRKNICSDNFKRLFNYKIVDMDSIYNLSKIRQNKIDRILGILDNIPTYNKIEDFIK